MADAGENVEPCRDCSNLDEDLRLASESYVGLIVRHDQMIRDGKLDDGALESATRKARRKRNAAARLLLSHRRTHEDFSWPKTATAG